MDRLYFELPLNFDHSKPNQLPHIPNKAPGKTKLIHINHPKLKKVNKQKEFLP